jgi:hypothetical protein
MEKLPLLIVFLAALLIMVACYPKLLMAAQKDLKVPGSNIPGQPGLINRPKVEYKAPGSRDPFEPLVVEEKVTSVVAPEPPKELPNFTVQGLVWGGVFPQAIINDQVVKKGDVLGDVKIVEIGKEGVTVLFGNKEYVLSPSAVGSQQPTAATTAASAPTATTE